MSALSLSIDLWSFVQFSSQVYLDWNVCNFNPINYSQIIDRGASRIFPTVHFAIRWPTEDSSANWQIFQLRKEWWKRCNVASGKCWMFSTQCFVRRKLGFHSFSSMLTAEPPVGKIYFHKYRLALVPFIKASLKVISINTLLLRFGGERASWKLAAINFANGFVCRWHFNSKSIFMFAQLMQHYLLSNYSTRATLSNWYIW